MPDDNQQNDNHQDSDITLEKLQADLDSAMNNWKRTAADFDNYKKQKERENKELLEFAREVTVVKLLPTLDALEQALHHMPELPPSPSLEKREGGNAQISEQPAPSLFQREGGDEFKKLYANWQTGVNGILSQLDKVLAELGVKKIEAIGKKFDPHFHEAIREVESEEDGIILDELQSGFILNRKVIRPSQVIISKRKSL